MDTVERQEDMTLEDEPLRSEGVQYATGEERRVVTNSSRENEAAGPKQELLSQHLAAVAAAKSLQLCLTLCDPIDGSPTGSSVPVILQTRTLEWVAISFCNA